MKMARRRFFRFIAGTMLLISLPLVRLRRTRIAGNWILREDDT